MPPTFALLSPCGGNLGDAAIQDAVIANIRSRYADARILGITLNPRDTMQRHGIPAYPLGTGPRRDYHSTNSAVDEARDPGRAIARPWAVVSHLSKILRTIGRCVLPEPLWRRLRLMRDEGKHLVGAFRWLHSVDTLIVSGGGQLDDFWEGPWGHPWSLFKWSLLAKCRNVRILFLSVGYASLDSRWSRLL